MGTVQSLAATGPAVNPPVTKAGAEIQDRFLKLLVTQMKNQDPLNPMDNAQVTSQLAQLSTVNGIQDLNTTMQGFATTLQSAQSLQSTALIGRTVLVDGNQLNIAGKEPVFAAIELTQSADNVKVNIMNASGSIVRQLNLGPQKDSTSGFQWDGLDDSGAKVADGSYSFQVAATSGGQKIDATSFMAGTVSSVTLGSDGAHLAVGGIGDVQLQQIKRIM